MVRIKPHTFVHIPVTETVSGGRVDVPAKGESRAIRCQITPLAAEAAFKTFGGDIQVGQPYLLLCDVTPYNRTIKSGDRGTFNGAEFYVNAAPMHWEAGRSTDCIQILLEKEQR